MPSNITIFDINPLAIDKAKKGFVKDPTVKAHSAELDAWIQNDKSRYGGIIAIWTLSYLSGPVVDRFLQWAKVHAEYLLFVEPTHDDFKELEMYLDFDQQMISRNKIAYEYKFVEHGFKVLHIDQFIGEDEIEG